MKEILSALGSEVFGPLVTIVLPGGIAISSWMTGLIWAHPKLRDFADKNHSETIAAIVVLSVFFGLICEDLGTCIEGYVFDKLANRRTGGKHERDWYQYLRLSFNPEPVWHHAVRTLVMRLKFELGSLVGCLSAMVGVWWFSDLVPWKPSTFVLAGSAVLFLIMAKITHTALSELRAEMLKGCS